MKKTISGILPFIGMFVLATGSVVLSCATAPSANLSKLNAPVSLNTDRAQGGKLYTTWVFDRFDSVLIVDEQDRSRKIELARNEWKYNPDTTELCVLKEIPFSAFYASIEGLLSLPHTFVLNGITDETDLLVILSDRLAIEGYDYTFNSKESRLSFRNDVDLKQSVWSIQYSTPYGGAMIGEWKPENADRMSYIEAEHRKRWLDAWYDRQTAFWFFDDAKLDEWKANRDQPPRLIRRTATSQELADMKALPSYVVKFRSAASDKNLSREIGFDARAPKKLETKSPSREFFLAWKSIQEYSLNGTLARQLDIAYEDRSRKDIGQYIIGITVENASDVADETQKYEWLINEETIDLGVPVTVRHQWCMQISNLDAKPTVIKGTSWTWSEGSIRCQANADSANDGQTEALLRQFIAERKKGK